MLKTGRLTHGDFYEEVVCCDVYALSVVKRIVFEGITEILHIRNL